MEYFQLIITPNIGSYNILGYKSYFDNGTDFHNILKHNIFQQIIHLQKNSFVRHIFESFHVFIIILDILRIRLVW